MNTFTTPFDATPKNVAQTNYKTMNGAPTLGTSGKAIVDLFFLTGASRNQNIVPTFISAFAENQELALRTMLYARDIRKGQGERKVFRDVLKHLEKTNLPALRRVLPRVPELGRWDDLLVLEKDDAKAVAFSLIKDALLVKNDGLCAKWMPRKGALAVELRNYLGLTPKQYRKLLVSLSKTVEQQMCANQWNEITYDHVPSVASARYRKAFYKHDAERYGEYVAALKRQAQPDYKPAEGEKIRKVNAGAIFPHDVLKDIANLQTRDAAEAQWAALPDFVGEGSFLPMLDVSGSMGNWNYYGQGYGYNGGPQPIQICISLGIYLSERNKSAFKDLVLSFDSTPKFHKLTGSVAEKAEYASRMPWGGSTNIELGFKAILDHAKKNDVAPQDMPKSLIIISDMEFNTCTRSPNATAYQSLREQYEKAGYELPQVVFWNVNGREGNSPVHYTQLGTALVSGYSPSIMKNVLAGKGLSPLDLVLDTIMQDRYQLAA